MKLTLLKTLLSVFVVLALCQICWAQSLVVTESLRTYGPGNFEVMAVSPDGKYIATGGSNRGALWEIATGNRVSELIGHVRPILDIAFSSDGKFLLTGSEDNSAKLWAIENKKELFTFEDVVFTFEGLAAFVAITPDSKTVITTAGAYSVQFWSAEDGSFIRSVEIGSDVLTPIMTSIAISPDGESFAVSGNDGNAWLYSMPDGSFVDKIEAAFLWCHSVAFSPDGQLIVTGTSDVDLWSVSGEFPLKTFDSNQGWITSVAFAPDGKSILSGGGSNDSNPRAELWSVGDGALIKSFEGHTGSGVTVAFLPNGRFAITGGQDGTAKLWAVSGVEVGYEFSENETGDPELHIRFQTVEGFEYVVQAASSTNDGGSWEPLSNAPHNSGEVTILLDGEAGFYRVVESFSETGFQE